MASRLSPDQHASDNMATDSHAAFQCRRHHGLDTDSHTAEKLHHASPRHMHMTSRRFFIGPIPQGWLQNHRKSWWRTRMKFGKYSSKTVTFSADPIVAHYTQGSDTDQDDSAPEESPAATDTTEDEWTEREQEDETSDQEARPQSDLRTVPYTLAEDHDISRITTTASDTAISHQGDNEHDWNPSMGKRDGSSAYYTAREQEPNDAAGASSSTMNAEQLEQGSSKQTLSTPSQNGASQSSPLAPASDYGSTTALLRPDSRSKGKGRVPTTSSMNLEQQEPQVETAEEEPLRNGRRSRMDPLHPFSRKAAKHNLDDNLLDKQQRVLSRISRTQAKLSRNLPHRRKMKEGEVIKAEKMLVRIEETVQEKLPDDYSENDSYKMETRVVDHWREYLVACRLASDEDAPFSLQMYKTRVIPEVQKAGTRVAPVYEVPLGRKRTKVNLYSHLDKAIVLWGPCKHGTKIYIIRPKSSAHAVEWFTFLSQVMGRRRPSSLPIHVPDLGVSLVFNNPFGQLEAALDSQKKNTGILSRAVIHEESAATAIVQGCLKLLENRPEWAEVLQRWSKTEIMGLAWKRYDRLEWILGANEERMYGSLAMHTSHELELRPRQHYNTYIKRDGEKADEPEPVEGFLVRLTSQRGVHQRMNKMFFKRLYFFTQDHYLFFCRPSKSLPPAPPRLCRSGSDMPSTQQILDASPLSYEVDPYPLQDGDISWLLSGNKEHIRKHDEEAFVQRQRNIHNLEHADGFIDLSKVQEVRNVRRGSCPADPNIEAGPDVEFHPDSRDTHRDDGATRQFDDDRTFEMLLDNKLVVRFQAYNETTKNEWMQRLEALVKYWKDKIATDAAEIKALRQRNLELLGIDEELESIMGQFAKKWEVKKAEASPLLHNVCLLSGCRTIKISGQLYRKPRRHSTFKKTHVVLTAGKLLIFRSSLRKRNGVEVPHIHQNLETSIDLNDCYIYSGLLTDSDLLYANQTFDSNHPGHHSLPRVYLSSDVYTSSDEDTAITFVIWQPLKKNLFRAREHGLTGQTKQRLKQVSTLGVHGRTIVFKARSRIEKDRWVLSIASEINRLQEDQPEDVRIIT
ncbi:uncharacterized protein BO80DRAFT_427517 [Aspergillus ibericus CBS 121593]|uniref:PH domain-containing protein n=1 Tax=Aspergillus ibericus CBS 121593 TaxID=1448316 RepID=A0A395GTD7_9EURO|nr:hypothetical protein BO80DRAFT_427517 [Aspergillus ibericus CBS 121593]RAK98218.1 hypothetical protein BO80DRAFT_427517 [Aspergillus ibericus CBS 121593]